MVMCAEEQAHRFASGLRKGPTSVSCFKGIGYEDGQMKHFVHSKDIGDGAERCGRLRNGGLNLFLSNG